MANWDVIVVGLGGVGSAAAYHLAAGGYRVLGIDQYPPAHALGSSHGKTRIIRQAYFEHPAYVPLLRRAYELWDDLGRLAGEQLFHRTGLVELGPADGIVIPGVLRSAQAHGLEVEKLTPREVTQRWPGLLGHQDWQAVIERDAGYLRVEASVAAHLRLAHQSGASCVHGVTVLQWHGEGDSVKVTTDTGVESAGRLVIAGGPWSNQLLQALTVNLRVLRKHQYWFGPQQPGYRQSDGFPCFFHETPAGFFYGFPAIDNTGVKVAQHSGGMVVDKPTTSHPIDQEDRQRVDQYVAEFLPGVGNELKAHAGCYYTVTPDEHFIVDRHPEYEQVTIIAGLSGHGFKFTSVLGEIASQLAMDGAASLETQLFKLRA